MVCGFKRVRGEDRAPIGLDIAGLGELASCSALLCSATIVMRMQMRSSRLVSLETETGTETELRHLGWESDQRTLRMCGLRYATCTGAVKPFPRDFVHVFFFPFKRQALDPSILILIVARASRDRKASQSYDQREREQTS